MECAADGSFKGIKSCTATDSGSTKRVEIITAEYAAKDVVTSLYYYGYISYPNANVDITGFTIQISYRSTVIANAATIKKFTTSPAFTDVTGMAMTFDPMNEGEIADYEFKWRFTSQTALAQATHSFQIHFPSEFDPRLSKYKLDVTSTTL